jgi:hypothetical protein
MLFLFHLALLRLSGASESEKSGRVNVHGDFAVDHRREEGAVLGCDSRAGSRRLSGDRLCEPEFERPSMALRHGFCWLRLRL